MIYPDGRGSGTSPCRDKKVADFLDQELSATFGVLESKANPRTGTVLINFNDQVVTTSHLLHVLEGMLHDFENPRSRSDGPLGVRASP